MPSRWRHTERHRTDRIGWLRAAVLGANDGIVSTASLVLGVAAASADHSSILLTGVAGLVAGAMSMAAVLATLADDKAPEGALDLAIEVGDSVMTHRRRFALVTARETVVELLALDEMNPRAIRFQLDGIRDQLSHLPGASGRGVTRSFSFQHVAPPRKLQTYGGCTPGGQTAMVGPCCASPKPRTSPSPRCGRTCCAKRA